MKPLKDKKKQKEIDEWVHKVLARRGFHWEEIYEEIGDGLVITRHYYLTGD